MAMTEYTKTIDTITNIGTNATERGLTTQEFKSKFDYELQQFVAWFNDTHKTEFEALVSEFDALTAADIPITDGGEHYTATDVEGALTELFTSVSSGKDGLAADVENKGGTVSQAGDHPTFDELSDGIDSIFVGEDTSDATAGTGDVLAPKTFYANGKKTGTMPDRGTYNITPSASNRTIPAGKHSGSGVVYGDANLIAGNIKSGVNIFGITGNFAGGAQIASGSVWATGVGSTFYIHTGVAATFYSITLNVGFTPKVVIAIDATYGSYSTTYQESFTVAPAYTAKIKTTGPSNPFLYIIKENQGAAAIGSTTVLPVWQFNTNYNWIAIG